MIELGTDEHYLAIYQRGATNDTFQCALDLTYGDLHAWYEPVYFARADVQRCVQELSAVIDVRRTIAGLKVAKPTTPDIELILTPNRGRSANYRLRLNVVQEQAGMLLEAEHMTVTLDVSQTNLLSAFREMYQLLPDALDTLVRPRLIDLGGIETEGCLIHYPLRGLDQPPEDNIVTCLVDVQLDEISVSHCAQSLFTSDLERFAGEMESVAQGEAESASLRSLDQRFRLELVTLQLRRKAWMRVELRAFVVDSSQLHEETLSGGYVLLSSVMIEAARTMRALLRAEGPLEGQQQVGD